jgi:arsenate reductase
MTERRCDAMAQRGPPTLATPLPRAGEGTGVRVYPRMVLFLCPHGAAKSVLAAARFQQLAASHGLDLDADAAGTDPDAEVSPAVAEALRMDGIDVSGQRPRRVTRADLVAALDVVLMGCDLDGIALPGARVEHWDDVPPLSQGLAAARAVIDAHVTRLVDQLAAARAAEEHSGAAR